ncbi:Com family DNA-binding transcriptional regulator [uncultured Desulfovibrio sp.]|uniref:Com family DNA-binding transcriptional regulator n=1 Tax=uncultured Desulfovibrio sp. TaxID=167968 RepID=UPI00261C4158|nr:Com family DNA-binding transcriptional regulator [uncultured Desulfovibrio sp.]
MQKEVLEEIRCRHCGKLLAKGQARVMEFKCPRCGAFTILRATRPGSERSERPQERFHAESGQPDQRSGAM